MPPAPPGEAEGNERDEKEGMPSRCVYMHSPLPNTQFFNHNAFTKESKHHQDFIPDLLSTLSAAVMAVMIRFSAMAPDVSRAG
jgi:hypothetical protein